MPRNTLISTTLKTSFRFLSTMTSTSKHLRSGSEYPPLKENQLRLYSMRFCPYVHRAKLVLAAKNIPYEEISINLVDRPDWYLKRNPCGQVPSLEWIDDQSKETRFIAESLVVSDYLDEYFPQKRLQPTNPYEKAQQRVLIERFGNIVSAFYKIIRTDPKQGVEDLNRHLAAYEVALTGPFFGGSKPAMVDYMLWPWFERLFLLNEAGYQFNDDGNFPKLAGWIQSMEENENVQQVKVPDDVTKKFMDTYRQGTPEYDI